MDLLYVEIAVVSLYAVSALLIATALIRQRLTTRAAIRHQRRVESLRPAFEIYVIDGAPLPREAARSPEAVLELALRYAAILRGKEAARIVDYLENIGLVERALSDLGARSAWRRARAADSLGRLRVRRAVPALIAALSDSHEDVRTVAARALAGTGDPRAVAPLAQALADPSRWTLSLVAENLMAMGSEVVPPLADLLDTSTEHNVRNAIVKILGEIRDPAATPALVSALLGDDSLNLRAQAAASLGRLGGPLAENALLVAIDDPAWEVRAQAAKALGRLGNPQFAHVLARAMPDPSWWVRVNCAEALMRLGDDGIDALENLMAHPDPYVRDQALAAFAMYGVRRRSTAAGASGATPPIALPQPE
jgi:HEAT repeat protein